MLWFGAILLTLIVAGLLVWPLFRPANRQDALERAQYDLAVYRDQLAELERDIARGALSEDQAGAARNEIQRRMLQAADQAHAQTKPTSKAAGYAVIGLLAVGAPLAALGLYLFLGQPQFPDQPHGKVVADRLGMPPEEAKKIAQQVEGLAARLAEQPNDARGWLMLARSYKMLGRYEESVEGFRRSIGLGLDEGSSFADLGEVLTLENEGQVPSEGLNSFIEALRRQPGDPKSLFYVGQAKLQIGDAEGAIAVWRYLEQSSRPDDAWMPVLKGRIAEAGQSAKVDPRMVKPAAPDLGVLLQSGHPQSGAGGAPAMPGIPGGGDQAAMIGQMVTRLEERLKTTPDDADGWSRLGRSYSVMGQPDKAAEAYGRAFKLKSGDSEAKFDYAYALIEAAKAKPGGKIPPEADKLMREYLAANPDSLDALYLVGLAEFEKGDSAKARQIWIQVRDRLPEGSPDRKEVEDRLKTLAN
jgi:cytochrome c-type biogenesis protein CcmH